MMCVMVRRSSILVMRVLYGRWNCDFSKVGRCPLRRINELEVAVLQVLQYNVRVASSLFARYFGKEQLEYHLVVLVSAWLGHPRGMFHRESTLVNV